MSQNPNDDQPLDTTGAETGAPEPTDATVATPTAATPTDAAASEQTDATASESDDATQVLDPAGSTRQFTQDDPLSVFDQGATPSPYATGSYATGSYGTGSYGTGSYATGSYGTASPDTGAAQPADAPQYAIPPAASYGAAPAAGWAAPPKPLVRTTPRTSTIVWGFIILAIGVGAISVAAGATLDVGLAMIWLLAAAGAVLIVASVVSATRRRNRVEGAAQG